MPALEMERTLAKKVLVSSLIAVLCALTLGGFAALAQSPEPTKDRLAPPAMPTDPTQADLGAEVYYQNCMSCHGDRGQGLTDEWRSAWSEGDQNCWQAKCHGASHPPSGFELVRYVPPVIGEGLLARFQNADRLHGYISARMPWENPGRLTEDEYWQVTAFLIRANGLDVGQEPLGPQNATGGSLAEASSQVTHDLLPTVLPKTMPPQRATEVGWWAIAIGVLVVGTLTVAGIWLFRRARS